MNEIGMASQIALECRNTAGGYFKEGYNCAESMFLTYRPLLAPDADPDGVRMFTGFGSGLGESGCLCGALTGAIAALGMLKGRDSNDKSRDEAYLFAREFTDRFADQFGATCCRVLNPHPFETREHLVHCLKITGNTSKILMEYLIEKGLFQPESGNGASQSQDTSSASE